jgi:hypothetical protein
MSEPREVTLANKALAAFKVSNAWDLDKLATSTGLGSDLQEALDVVSSFGPVLVYAGNSVRWTGRTWRART